MWLGLVSSLFSDLGSSELAEVLVMSYSLVCSALLGLPLRKLEFKWGGGALKLAYSYVCEPESPDLLQPSELC